MSKLTQNFKKSAVAVFDWSHRNRVKAAIWGVLLAGGGYGYIHHHVVTATGDERKSELEWRTVSKDITQLAAAATDVDTLNNLKRIMKDSPGALTISVDRAKLEQDKDRLWKKFDDARDKTIADFSFARNISLDTMDSLREQINQDVGGWSKDFGTENEPSSWTIRRCQDGVMDRDDFKGSPSDVRDIQSCIAMDASTEGVLKFLLAGLVLSVSCLTYTVTAQWSRDAKLAEKDLAAQGAEQPAPAADPNAALPMETTAPTIISKPLRLKTKRNGLSFKIC
jgi:hypothetical protein